MTLTLREVPGVISISTFVIGIYLGTLSAEPGANAYINQRHVMIHFYGPPGTVSQWNLYGMEFQYLFDYSISKFHSY